MNLIRFRALEHLKTHLDTIWVELSLTSGNESCGIDQIFGEIDRKRSEETLNPFLATL